MVDYTKDIGGSTTLMIRDTGGNVEFWVRTGSQTWNNDQWWSYFANGGSSRQKSRLVRGGNWQQFGAVYVGYDQDVSFTIEGAGLGFPTSTITARIQRATVPQPPTINQCYPLSSSYIRVGFYGNSDGGSPIREWQIGYGNNPDYPTALWGSNGLSDIGPFNSGERVFFWARGRNDLGWSGWGNRAEATTHRVPDAPSPVYFDSVTQKSVRAMFNGGYDGGTPIREWQLAYGKNPAGGDTIIGSGGTSSIDNLDPGKIYYFWARGRNDVGWGPWSEVRQLVLIAGARIPVDGSYRRAVPYVKVNGTWRLARPWVKDQGTWKEGQG